MACRRCGAVELPAHAYCVACATRIRGDGISTREAAKRRHCLDGADAQALEGALQQVERELDKALCCDQCGGKGYREEQTDAAGTVRTPCPCGDGTMRGLVADMRRELQARLECIAELEESVERKTVFGDEQFDRARLLERERDEARAEVEHYRAEALRSTSYQCPYNRLGADKRCADCSELAECERIAGNEKGGA